MLVGPVFCIWAVLLVSSSEAFHSPSQISSTSSFVRVTSFWDSSLSPSLSLKQSSFASQKRNLVQTQPRHCLSGRRRIQGRLAAAFFDDFEEFEGILGSPGDEVKDIETGANNAGDDFYAALRRRQDSLSNGGAGSMDRRKLDPLKNRTMNTNDNNKTKNSLSDVKDKNHGSLMKYPDGRMGMVKGDSNDMDEDEYERLLYNWRQANCISTVRLTLPDWIRRLAVDLYPLVVCGSASGNLYLGDLEEGDVLDCLENVHAAQVVVGMNDDRDIAEALTKLYGKYDGGGVLALAIKDDLIVSAGREGGVHVCTIVGEETEVYLGIRGGTSRQTKLRLQREGKLRGLEGNGYGNDLVPGERGLEGPTPAISSSAPLITSLIFDSQGTLWVAGYDGTLRGYHHEELDANARPLMLRQKHAEYEINIGSPIVSMTVNDELGCGVLTTTTKGVLLFSLDDGQVLGQWNPFEYSKREEFARTALIVATEESGDDYSLPFGPAASLSRWTLVTGGSKGSMYQRSVAVDPRTGFIDEESPFLTSSGALQGQKDQIESEVRDDRSEYDEEQVTLDIPGVPQKIRPNHLGPIVDLASPAPGLFISGSHDGTMRVWSCDTTSRERNKDADTNDKDKTKNRGVHGSNKKPKVLYALSGYKVWLGSIFANRRKLVSDGADNSIIVHAFDEDEEDVIRSREEDEEDELDDGDLEIL